MHFNYWGLCHFQSFPTKTIRMYISTWNWVDFFFCGFECYLLENIESCLLRMLNIFYLTLIFSASIVFYPESGQIGRALLGMIPPSITWRLFFHLHGLDIFWCQCFHLHRLNILAPVFLILVDSTYSSSLVPFFSSVWTWHVLAVAIHLHGLDIIWRLVFHLFYNYMGSTHSAIFPPAQECQIWWKGGRFRDIREFEKINKDENVFTRPNGLRGNAQTSILHRGPELGRKNIEYVHQ